MRYPIEDFIRAVNGVPCSRELVAVRSKSRDRYGVSPLLRQMLKGRVADLVVSPRSLDEVVTVARAAVRLRIPITPRGGGTANYGQSVPLEGGILLDMTGLAGVVSVTRGGVRALAGTLVHDMDMAARAEGWEMRIYPTTRRAATIGGFVAGGSGGPGSINHGHLSERGNILAAQIVTMEDEPRVLELTGPEAQRIHHTYGATGIVTELDMPTEPTWPWRELICAFPEYMQAIECAIELGRAPGITKKVMSVQDWPTPSLMKPLAPLVPEGHAIVSTMVPPHCLAEVAEVVAGHGGHIASDAPEGEGPYKAPLTEFVFGHALFHIRKSDPRRAMLEGYFHGQDLAGVIARVRQAVGRHGPMRMELLATPQGLAGTGSPYFVYESPEQMAALVREMQAAGALVSNSHTSNVRAVGKRDVGAADFAFKRMVDPHNLLNPGRFEIDPARDARFEHALPTDPWKARTA